MKSMDDYLPIVGEKAMGNIYQKAHRLINKHIVHINSTAQGGGVAEILNNLVLLMNDVGIDTGWRKKISIWIQMRGFPNLLIWIIIVL